MTTQDEALNACLSLPFTVLDYPFGEEWAVVRHQENQKIIAMVFWRNDRFWMNLKAEPLAGDFWRRTFPSVVPAYHMNKKHWISVILDGSMTNGEVMRLIEDSYALTAPKRRKSQAESI